MSIALSIQIVPVVLTMTSVMQFHYFFIAPWIYLVLLVLLSREREEAKEL
jgi:hypothetical protein